MYGVEFGLSNKLSGENLQARVRGILLMLFANNTNSLLVTTGNRSELMTGYCTLYGDMCGGLNVIGDLYKTQVYDLARYLNRQVELIPGNILLKAPSAELGEGQRDIDDLPPYDVLDSVLRGRDMDNELVSRLVLGSRFKRLQMAPVLCSRTGELLLGDRYEENN